MTRVNLAVGAVLLALTAAPLAAAGSPDQAPDLFGGSLWASIVATAVFLGLVAILSKTAYPKIVAGLQERERKIEASLHAAERASAETAKVTAELEAKLVATRAEASKLVDKAKADAVLVAQTELEKARSEIKLERERAQREIQIARDTALQEVVNQAADWSVALAGKIVQRELNRDSHRELIAKAIDELKN